MLRISNLKHQEICESCISYLLEKGIYEKGLFRFTPAVVDVKKLQQQMAQVLLKARDEQDNHVIGGVLQLSLKEMTESLLHEVFDDITKSDVNDVGKCKAAANSYLCKLPPTKLQLFRSICTLLKRVSEVGGNEANLPQLAFIFAPFLCRPANSAYMSIRHSESLKTIRPALQTILEHQEEVFRDVRSIISTLPSRTLSGSKLASNHPNYNNNSNTDSNKQLTATLLSSSSQANRNMSSNTENLEQSFHSQEPSTSKLSTTTSSLSGRTSKLHLSISVPSSVSLFDNDVAVSPSANASTSTTAPPLRFLAWEWKALELLTQTRMTAFLKGDSGMDSSISPRSQPLFQSVGMGFPGGSGSLYTLGSRGGTGSHESEVVVTSLDVTLGRYIDAYPDSDPANTSMQTNATVSSGTHSSAGSVGGGRHARGLSTRAMTRRHMISECKALRQQIFLYEEECMQKFGRALKSHERGPAIGQVFASYRDMKRAIRDHAALDIQRCIRGALTRMALSRKKARGQGNNGGSGTGSVPMDTAYSSGTLTREPNLGVAAIGKPYEVIAQYRELLLQKKDLKRRLKKFDEDFLLRHGRAAKKQDKEVMRPLYQQYHEVKAMLDNLKSAVEKLVALGQAQGLQSADLDNEDNDDAEQGSVQATITSAITSVTLADTDSSRGGFLNTSSGSAEVSMVSTNVAVAVNSAGGKEMKAQTQPAPIMSSSSADSSASNKMNLNDPNEVAALQEEKRALHAYLKKYERDFNQKYGRHVMRPEDIEPVAAEYQRYKVLKKFLKAGR